MTKIIQVADIHFGTENPDALEAFNTCASSIGADAMAVCGDLTQRGKRSEFKAARRWLDSFDMPKLVVAGNHDTPLLNLYERVVAPFDRHDRHFGDLARPAELERAKLVGLNTSRGWQTRGNWAEGSVNLEDLEDAISAVSPLSGKHGFLICHHPFLSPPKAPLRTATRRGRRASRRLAQSNINFLLTGHVHSPSVTVVDHKEQSYVAVSAGTLSTRLRDHPASFNMIEIMDGICTVTVFNLDGDEFVPQLPHEILPDALPQDAHVEIGGTPS